MRYFPITFIPDQAQKKEFMGFCFQLVRTEGWAAPHCSAVQSISPYDNVTTFMHEGASGGGKSEMLQMIVREPEGHVLIGENLITGEKRTMHHTTVLQDQPGLR
jgi:hypothetical protein